MKILRAFLLLGGVLLIGFGLTHMLFPEYEIVADDANNQIIGIIGLGILAILASIFAKNRR